MAKCQKTSATVSSVTAGAHSTNTGDVGRPTYSELDETDTYNTPNETGTYNELDETNTYNEPNETGTYNELDEMDTYNELDETGTYNELDETGTHNKSVTYSKTIAYSTGASETPPELPPYDGARTALPLTRLLHISWFVNAYNSLTARCKVSVMVVGCAVILILFVSGTSAVTAARSQVTTSESQAAGQLIFTSVADDQHWVYADGFVVNHLLDWHTVLSSSIPTSTVVLGVKVINIGGLGDLLGSLSDGHTTYAVTDNTWRCTRQYYDNWANPSFNAKTWPRAEPMSQDTPIESPSGRRWPQVAPNAQWIWNGPRKIQHPDIVQLLTPQTVTVYCRKTLNITKPT